MTKKYNIFLKRTVMAMIAIIGLNIASSAQSFRFDGLNYTVTSGSARTVEVADNTKLALSGAINIPSTVTYNTIDYTVTSIHDNAFLALKEITEIVVPGTVTTVGNGSFANCPKLKVLDLGESVSSIGNDIFTGLGSLEFVVCRNTTPPTVAHWGATTSSASLYVPASVLETYKTADVWGNFKVICEITPSSPKYPYFPYVKTLKIGDKVTSIEKNAYAQCKDLSEVTLGSSVSTIADGAFNECVSLAQITLPATVGSIGSSAFAGCTTLTDIYAEAVTPPAVFKNTFEDYHYTKVTVHVSDEAVDNYVKHDVWGLFKYENVGGITDVEIDSEWQPCDVYNLQGIRVLRNATLEDVNALSPGLYIMRGQKVIIRD